MTTVYRYKIYCNTEATYVQGLLETEPTVCFNNSGHSINVNSIQIIETISQNLVSVKEDKVNIQRNTWVDDIPILDVAPGETKIVSYTFPFIVSLYSFMFVPDSTNKGDNVSIIANENTTMGLIGADITAGATTLLAPIGLLTYGMVGLWLIITDGTNTDDLGMILAIDKVTGIVTFQTAAVHNFSSTNTLVKMTVKVMNAIRIGGPGVYRFFDDVIGGAPIPTGTVVKFKYTNNSPVETPNKELVIYLSCLY